MDNGLKKYGFISPGILTLLCISAIAISFKGIREAGENPAISYTQAKGALTFNLAILFTVVFMAWCLYPNFMKARLSGQAIACESNIKKIATALNMYADDNEKLYPDSLKKLEGQYIKKEVLSVVNKKPYGYTCNNNTENYTIWCPEPDIHEGWSMQEGCWPQYSSGEGIMYK